MNYKNSTAEQFAQYVKTNEKKIIVFGAGAVCKTYIPYITAEYELWERIICIVDNNPAKQGERVDFGKVRVPIKGIDCLKNCREDYCVIISNGDFYSVMKQLDGIDECHNKVCFIAAMMQLDRQYDRSLNAVYRDFAMPQIPKIIKPRAIPAIIPTRRLMRIKNPGNSLFLRQARSV